MKHMKKIASFVLAAIMVLAMVVPTFAANLTINDTRANRTYEAYQIVTGDISGTEASGFTLTNLKWGTGVSAVDGTSVTSGALLTEAQINALPASNASRADIKAYVDKLTLTNVKAASSAKTGAGATGYEFTGLAAGWYLVKETTVTSGTDDFTTAFLMEVVGDATADIKGSKTTVEKKVDDVNDSTGTAELLKDSADHDIGDDITFTLTAKLGDDLTDYSTYKLVFTDNLSKGLTYKELVSVSVMHGATTTTKNNSIVTVEDGAWDGTSTAYTDGSVKKFTITNVLDSAVGAVAGDSIIIKYKATLNSDAVMGSEGNPNKVYLEYSNNPASGGLGKTGEDTNKVFTYKAVFDKVTTENEVTKHLTGAEFTLFKVKSTITDAEVAALSGSSTVDGTTVLKQYSAVTSAGKFDGEASEVASSVFTFNHIDDGTYVLVETSTPTGYNTAANKKFVVTATHSEESATPELLTLTGNRTSGIVDAAATTATDSSTNSNTANIVNNKGTELPTTGGIGTTIFYVLGSILVLGAVILLVTRRRMSR